MGETHWIKGQFEKFIYYIPMSLENFEQTSIAKNIQGFYSLKRYCLIGIRIPIIDVRPS